MSETGRYRTLTAILCASMAAEAIPQKVITPPKGSALRTQILDAIRPSKIDGKKIVFIVWDLRVYKSYAYFCGAGTTTGKMEGDGGQVAVLRRDANRRWRVLMNEEFAEDMSRSIDFAGLRKAGVPRLVFPPNLQKYWDEPKRVDKDFP